MKSPAFSFKSTGRKILTGAAIAMAGALATYFEQEIGSFDFGSYQMVAVSINSVVVNAIRMFTKEYS